MGVLAKFTLKTLLKNRMRTIVTLIGIILSMALLTAVIEGGHSGFTYLQEATEYENGSFYGYFSGLTAEDIPTVAEMKHVTKTGWLSELGWAECGSVNTGKPYLLVTTLGEGSEDLAGVRIVEGRLPENDSELVVPRHLQSNGGVNYRIGDTVTLNVGKRTASETVLNETIPLGGAGEESITDTEEKTYTVVGICNRLSFDVEYMNCPGYTAFTRGEPSDNTRIFFRLDSARNYNSFVSEHVIAEHPIQSNGMLLAFSGSVADGGLQVVFYGFVAILVILIAMGSIALIYNSFSISVAERTKQYGILKSIGATGRQIRRTVFFEALVLSVIAIPIGLLVGCVGIGTTLYFLRDAFKTMFDPQAPAVMHLVLNPKALLLASLCCLLTVLISAFIPARRALSVSPIMAIRENTAVKIRAKAVRTSRLTQKLFGFEGTMAAKNFKRDKRRYRATVVSLSLSIVLFISASSFTSYLKQSAEGIDSLDYAADIIYTRSAPPDSEELAAQMQMVSGIDGVTDCSLMLYYAGHQTEFDRSILSDSFLNNPYEDFSEQAEPEKVKYYLPIALIDDEHFAEYAKACGTSAEKLSENGARGILYNSVTTHYFANGKRRFYSFDLLKKQSVPTAIHSWKVREIEGYIIVSYGNGSETVPGQTDPSQVVYYPTDYLDTLYSEGKGNDQADPEYALVMSREEASVSMDFTVGCLSDFLPLGGFSNNQPFLIYPLSQLQEVIPEELLRDDVHTAIAIRSVSHQATADKLTTTLRDRGVTNTYVYDAAASRESTRMAILVINVFSYGFIILISLIATANVFNTISTNILLRRREFAMLKSVGLAESGLRKMLNYECLIYGLKGLLFGFPAAVLMTYVIYRITNISFEIDFYIPWQSIVIAVGSVFLVVFATMLYARRKLRRDNPIDALKLEML